METNEIMNNEEVMETTTEEIVKSSSGKWFKAVSYTHLFARITSPFMEQLMNSRKEN